MVSFDVAGKRIVIVGGSSGIGYTLAREFALAGAVVTIVAEVDDVFDGAATLSTDTGSVVRGLKCDITKQTEVDEMAANAGPTDVLINNAGIFPHTPIADPSQNHVWEKTMDINVVGLYRTTQAVLRNMADGGRIIFTSSILGKTAGPEFNSAYTASKHAVLGLVRSLAMELGPRGITVNAVCPGSTATDRVVAEFLEELSPEAREKLTEQMVIRPGFMEPEHLAGTYLFLASPAASEITAQAISVDRGQFIG